MIKIFNKNNKKYTQVFNFFTEENWEKQKSNYTKNFQAFFSGKKAEFAVSTDDETTQYFIGIGKENFQNFELQQVANKFSIQNKKNIQATPTKINGDFSEEEFSEIVKGLLLGTYSYPFKPEHAFWDQNFELHYKNFSQKKLDKISEKAFAIFNGQSVCMDWLNKPANFKNAEQISSFLKICI